MGENVKVNLISLLRDNADVFAFLADEMTGIDPAVMVHRLNVNENVRSVKQKKRSFSPKKNYVIKERIR